MRVCPGEISRRSHQDRTFLTPTDSSSPYDDGTYLKSTGTVGWLEIEHTELGAALLKSLLERPYMQAQQNFNLSKN